MNKTTHYQLNQWDPEDRIMRADFNADNAATDEALYENAQAAAEARQTALDAVAAEETARKDAVSSEAETRSSQDAAIRAELSAAVAEAKSEAAAAVAAIPFVKLRETVLAADAAQFDVSLAGLDITAYAEIMILPCILLTGTNGTSVYMRCNNISDTIYSHNGLGKDYFASFAAANRYGHEMLHLNCWGDYLALFSPATQSTAAVSYFDLKASEVTTLNFYSPELTLAAGSKVVIYGIKM